MFLDLNGTLVEPVQPTSLAELQSLPGVSEAVSTLSAAGYTLPVVTTQSRIEKGLFSEAEFVEWFDVTIRPAMPEIGGLYVCPHRQRADCGCHKPQTELFLRASRQMQFAIDERCWIIGDTGADIEAAERLGIRSCLVRTGWGQLNEPDFCDRATHVVDGVLEAARAIIDERQ